MTNYRSNNGIFSCEPNCVNRKPGCHDHCEKYMREKAEHDRRREAEASRQKIDSCLIHNIIKRSNQSAVERKNNRGRLQHRRG